MSQNAPELWRWMNVDSTFYSSLYRARPNRPGTMTENTAPFVLCVAESGAGNRQIKWKINKSGLHYLYNSCIMKPSHMTGNTSDMLSQRVKVFCSVKVKMCVCYNPEVLSVRFLGCRELISEMFTRPRAGKDSEAIADSDVYMWASPQYICGGHVPPTLEKKWFGPPPHLP